MGKGFLILRSMIFVFILAGVLAWVPVQVYQGDIMTSLLLSIAMFGTSVILALILLAFIKRS